jgi:alkylation response protein AidB-like acyl-CoA dehydrogenase
MPDAALLDAAHAIASRIRPHADAIEAGRGLPAAIVGELARAGLFRMLVPRALGGGEVSPATMIRAIEAIARGDGAAGWCVMVGATSGLMSAFLDEDTAREVYGDPEVVTSGVFAPMGRATDEGDGYRVAGHWSFASGVEHAAYRMGGVLVMGPGGPQLSASGDPVIRHLIFRAEDTRVADTWNTSGLRGTGSHDMIVDGVFVPRRRSASLGVDRPRHPGVLYRFPIFGLLALGIAAVALGIARESISALTALATGKRPMWSKKNLAHRELIQVQVAEAEGLVRSARAFLFEAAAEVTAIAEEGEIGDAERALLRLAATQATRAAAQAVDRMYHAGGGSSIYATSPLQRHFRDVHVATQHVMVAEPTYAMVGRVLLGVGGDVGML